MASTWGLSFGSSFGNSWGSVSSAKDVRCSWIEFDPNHVQPPSVVVTPSGGVVSRYHPWIHGYEKRKKFLEKHQIPEKVAEAIVSAVAVHLPEQTVSLDARALALAEREAREAVEKENLEWLAFYSRLIIIEYSRLVHEYEDAQIAWLLFEM